MKFLRGGGDKEADAWLQSQLEQEKKEGGRRADSRLSSIENDFGSFRTTLGTHGGRIDGHCDRIKSLETKTEGHGTRLGDMDGELKTSLARINAMPTYEKVVGIVIAGLALVGATAGVLRYLNSTDDAPQAQATESGAVSLPRIEELQNALVAVKAEGTVLDAKYGEGNPITLVAMVADDGTVRDGFAQYLCQVLGEFELGGGERVIIQEMADGVVGKQLGSADCGA